MKRGSGSNCFNNNTLASIYDDYENCAWCGGNMADCFDHVISRKNKYTDSIVNASPVHNHKCNIAKHGEMHTFDNQVKLLTINLNRLKRERYKLTEYDWQFINEYKQAQEAYEQSDYNRNTNNSSPSE